MPLLNRFWSWTSAQANAPLSIGPLRYRAWTSGSGAAPINFGPLRFHAWTEGAAGPSVAPLNFGALRFHAWTFGDEIIIPPTPTPSPIIAGGIRVFPDRFLRRKLEDDEILAVIMAWLHSTQRH